jgi:ribonuclease HIII
MAKKNSYTFPLDQKQQETLAKLLKGGNYLPIEVPHTRIAVEADHCNVMLYNSGKCLVQGKGATDWVQFNLEPLVLEEVRTGYEEALNPELYEPHCGIDESGKGDFFGPMVIASVYADGDLAHRFNEMGVKDSKSIKNDKKALGLASELRRLLGSRYALVTVGPRAYNRLYASMGSVNKLLAWGHARAIEDLLDSVPDCPRAVADQFGPERQIRQALMKKGRKIVLEQRPKAESDPAVAAASILARAGFLQALAALEKKFGQPIPKGASAQVREAATALVKSRGPEVLMETAKCHFRTTDQVLEAAGSSRSDLPQEGQVTSKAERGGSSGA